MRFNYIVHLGEWPLTDSREPFDFGGQVEEMAAFNTYRRATDYAQQLQDKNPDYPVRVMNMRYNPFETARFPVSKT